MKSDNPSDNPFELITQQNQTDVVTVICQDASQIVPNASWPLENLKGAILQEHEALLIHSRKTALHAYYLGRVLTFAKAQVKGTWGQFLKDVGISVATDNRTRKLYESTESEEALVGLTVTEGYIQVGVKLGKRTQTQSATVPLTIEDEDSENEVDDDSDFDDSDDEDSNDKDSDDDSDFDFEESENMDFDESDMDFDESEFDDSDDEDSEAEFEDSEFEDSDDDDSDFDETEAIDDDSNEISESPKLKLIPKDTPPKEDPDNFGMRMAQLVDRARWLAERIDGVVVKPSEADHWLSHVAEVRSFLTVIEGGLSHV